MYVVPSNMYMNVCGAFKYVHECMWCLQVCTCMYMVPSSMYMHIHGAFKYVHACTYALIPDSSHTCTGEQG